MLLSSSTLCVVVCVILNCIQIKPRATSDIIGLLSYLNNQAMVCQVMIAKGKGHFQSPLLEILHEKPSREDASAHVKHPNNEMITCLLEVDSTKIWVGTKPQTHSFMSEDRYIQSVVKNHLQSSNGRYRYISFNPPEAHISKETIESPIALESSDPSEYGLDSMQHWTAMSDKQRNQNTRECRVQHFNKWEQHSVKLSWWREQPNVFATWRDSEGAEIQSRQIYGKSAKDLSTHGVMDTIRAKIKTRITEQMSHPIG
jgi:hypothetical protein